MSLIGGEVDVSLNSTNFMKGLSSNLGIIGTTTGGFKTTEAPKYRSGQMVLAKKKYNVSRNNNGRMLVMIEARSCTPTTRKYPGTISSARVKRSKKVGGGGSDDGDENGWLYVLLFSVSGNGGNYGNGGNDDSNYGGSGDGAQDDYWMRDLLVLWFIFCAWSAWNVLQMALLPLSGLGARNDDTNTNRVTGGGLACCVSHSVSIE
jgi:hypothetical protein